MWEIIQNIFTYPLIDWNEQEIVMDNGEVIPGEDIFTFSLLNIILFVLIYFVTKLTIKYSQRYSKEWQLADKQLSIEGREIAVWRVIKQFFYLIACYVAFLSLKITNPHFHIGHLLTYEFIRFESFHIAVYHVFVLFAVIFVARIIVNVVKIFLLKSLRKNSDIDTGTEYIYVQLAKYLVYTVAIIIVLRSFGMNLDLFLTATTFLLVGVGLGLQAIFQDYFSGILLLLEGTVKVGDVIEIEKLNSNDENFVAEVKKISLRTSKVLTREDKVLVIPNSKLTQESVINWTAADARLTRFSIKVTFHYGVDTEKARQILVECAAGHPNVWSGKKPIARLLDFGLHGLEMDVLFWAEQNLYIDILKSEIRFKIDAELRKHEISIPYPQAEISFKGNPPTPPSS